MIYQPREAWSLLEQLGAGAQLAALLALGDFASSRQNKPWAFYLGVAFGDAAAATGVPFASAMLYMACDSFDVLTFKSPEGSEVRVFIDGILHTSFETYAATEVWEWLTINGLNPTRYQKVEFQNYAPAPGNVSGTQWMAFSNVRINSPSGQLQYGESWTMANYRIGISFLDADGATSSRDWYLVAADDATALLRAESLAEALDTLTDSQIVDVGITKLADTTSWTLKSAPVSGADNEIGGRFIYTVTGGFTTRLSIPGFKKDPYTTVGGNINTADTDIATFDTLIRTGGFSDYRWADIATLKAAYEIFGNKG